MLSARVIHSNAGSMTDGHLTGQILGEDMVESDWKAYYPENLAYDCPAVHLAEDDSHGDNKD